MRGRPLSLVNSEGRPLKRPATAAPEPGRTPLRSKGSSEPAQRRRILGAYESAYMILELVDVDINVVGFPVEITAGRRLPGLSQFLLERVGHPGVADEAGGQIGDCLLSDRDGE